MIYNSINIISKALNDFIADLPASEPKFDVIEENIAFHESNTGKFKDKIIATLIRVEEEPTLRNIHKPEISDQKSTSKYPSVNVNLFVCFSVNANTYGQGLKALSNVVRYFQAKRVFTPQDGISISSSTLPVAFRFLVELYSPSFDEMNNIWGMLGGKQFPSVFYKLRLVELEREHVIKEQGLITEITGTTEVN